MSLIQELIERVKTPENYVPRDYQTIGGMWTVDTWRLGDITVQLMDEGYTTVIRAPELEVVDGYHGIEYKQGSEADVQTLLYWLTND